MKSFGWSANTLRVASRRWGCSVSDRFLPLVDHQWFFEDSPHVSSTPPHWPPAWYDNGPLCSTIVPSNQRGSFRILQTRTLSPMKKFQLWEWRSWYFFYSACFSKTATPSSGLNKSSLVLRFWWRNSSLGVVLWSVEWIGMKGESSSISDEDQASCYTS